MDHRSLVSDNRPFHMSPGECERREGRAAHVPKAPIDTEGLPRPVSVQEGNHNGKSRRNPETPASKREIEHRGTGALGRKLAVETGELENKVSPHASFRSLACLTVSLETEIPSSPRTW